MTLPSPPATPAAAGPRPWALAALFSVHFGSAAMMRVCDPMLPALARDFGVTTGQAAHTVSSYAIAYGILQFFFGPAGDRWGKRRVIGFAALATLAGNGLALVAPSLEVLVLARVLSGAAAAGIIALVLAWVGDTVPYARRQAVLAKFLSASLAGMMAGQWISGVLTEHVGWRAVFALLALLLGVGGAAIVFDRSLRHEPQGAASSRGHLQSFGEVLRVPWARAMLAFVAIEGALAFGAIAFLPAYLAGTHGLGLASAAAIVALYGVGGFAYAFGARWLVPRLGEAGLALAGGVALGLAWLALAWGTHWWVALPASTLAGLGFYTLHGVMQTHATQMAPAVRGTAVCLFASAMFIGIACGVGVAGLLVDRVGYPPVFAASGVALAMLGAAFAASLRRRQRMALAA
ncbi:MAG: MFS transporter [Hydrogenophaga sp.]|uniref:MFS transporter n=1 Tax=Hydrogenophaga sp. TaxID=1904254 RepID=UPI003D132683